MNSTQRALARASRRLTELSAETSSASAREAELLRSEIEGLRLQANGRSDLGPSTARNV